jgi:hypothetical protein
MRISYDNFIDDIESTAITALTENTLYPVINTQDQRLAKTYQSTAVTAQTITIDLGIALTVTTVAILNHNFSNSTAMTVVVSANSANSWPGATSETLTYNAGTILKFFTGHTYRYWQFQITDPSNTDGYLEIGRLWLGDYITIAPSSLLNFKVSKLRSDNVLHGRGRQKYATLGIGWRKIELSFPPTNYTMVNKIETMYDIVGKHSSFIFCNFDSIRTYGIVEPLYGSITNDLVFTHDNNMKFNYSLIIEEDK